MTEIYDMTKSLGPPFSELPLVTTIVCTHGRPRQLARCLAALVPQALLRNWPVLVVDSGSAPYAAAEIKDCAKTFDTQFVRLDDIGLSKARNAGAALARSVWIAYLDDDAVPHADWSQKLEEELLGVSAQVAVVGGRIFPKTLPESPLPANLTPCWLLLLSCVTAVGRGDVHDGWNICGANFAVRRTALKTVGGFPEHLGRFGHRLIGGEESYVSSVVTQSGSKATYSSSFAVDHWIEPERLKVQWLIERAYWEGVTRVALYRALQEKLPLHLTPLKLAFTIPLLWVIASRPGCSPAWLIRLHKARGSLMAQLGRLQS